MNCHFHKHGAIALLLLSLAGCESGGISNVLDSVAGSGNRSNAMEPGLAYPVNDGNRVMTTSATPAELVITHELFARQRTVTLIQGEADLY